MYPSHVDDYFSHSGETSTPELRNFKSVVPSGPKKFPTEF